MNYKLFNNIYSSIKIWCVNRGILPWLVLLINSTAIIYGLYRLYKIYESGQLFSASLAVLLWAFISSMVTLYVLDGFKYSNNYYIKLVQRCIKYGIGLFLLVWMVLVFIVNWDNPVLCQPEESNSTSSKNDKDISKMINNKTGEEFKIEGTNSVYTSYTSNTESEPSTSKNVVKVVVTGDSVDVDVNFKGSFDTKAIVNGATTAANVVGNMVSKSASGIAAGAGVTGGWKATVGLPFGERVVGSMIGGVAGGVAGQLGQDMYGSVKEAVTSSNPKGDILSPQRNIMEKYEELGKYLDKYNDNNGPSASSVLEDGLIELSPIMTMVVGMLTLSVISWIFNVIFIYTLFNKFIVKNNIEIVLKFLNKFLNEKNREYIKNKLISVNSYSGTGDLIFIILLFIIISVLTIMIAISGFVLLGNIDKFCLNHLINYRDVEISDIVKNVLPLIILYNKKKQHLRLGQVRYNNQLVSKNEFNQNLIQSENISTNKLVKNEIIVNNPELNSNLQLIKIKLIENSKSESESERYNIEDVNIIISELSTVIEFILVVKDDYSKPYLSEVIKDISEYFSDFGLDKNSIKNLINRNIQEWNDKNSSIRSDAINNYMENILKIVGTKNVTLSDKVLNKLIHLLKIVERIGNEEVNKNVLELKNRLISDLQSVLKITSKKRGRNNQVKAMSGSDYKGEFSVSIGIITDSIKELVINYIRDNNKESLDILSDRISKIKDILRKVYRDNVDMLFESNSILDYSRRSMSHVIENKEREKDLLLSEFNIDRVNSIESMVNIINTDIDNSFNQRISKLNNDSPLTKMLESILNKNNLSVRDMQIGVEKALYNYDLSWFNSELNTSVDVSSTILHDIYKGINTKLNNLIQNNTINSFRVLKNLLDKESFNYNEGAGTSIIIFMLLGNAYVISICFKTILELLSQNKNEVSRTELAFKVASRLKRHCLTQIQRDRILEDKKIDKLISIWNLNQIQTMINKMDDLSDIELGDTILNIVLNDTNIFNVELSSNSTHDRKIIVSLRSEYLHKLAIASINVTQLPMLTKPNEPEDGKYSPYILNESSHIYNSFDTVVKNKYNNSLNTEHQEVLYKTINYLNSIKFKINKDVLNYILNEWDNKDSKLFNGANLILDISKEDKKAERIAKIAHNSIYWNYYNTIKLASLYINHEFYLPAFADFRGRIYTLSHYLSYQGNDLNRSLLLFADEQKSLNNKGFNYLLVYFANLYGKSKLSMEDRINWSKDNIYSISNDYSKDIINFNSKHLADLKEPLQFISIMFALARAIHSKNSNKPIIINNPILFDASCNGIQHLAAMTRDISLAINTNLIPNEASPDLPEDFYSFAGKLIQEELDQDEGNLGKIRLERTLIKKSVMTIPYNISLTGVGEQLQDHFEKITENKKYFYKVDAKYTKDNTTLFLMPKEFGLLTKLIYKTLTEKLPSLSILTKYLNSIVKLILSMNKPLIWITPTGLKINLSTIKYESVRTKTKLIKNSKPVTISLPSKDLDKMQIRRSFMPNLIHSLDATNIHLFIDKLQDEPVYTVHDCFATTANNMWKIEGYVKEAFIDIYFRDGNYLEKMHNHLMEQIKSYTTINTKEGKEFITIDNKDYEIPKLPEAFTNKKVMSIFIDGIHKSKFFIS